MNLLANVHQVVSTLLEAGFSRENLGQDNLEVIAGKLQHVLDNEKGLVGFGKLIIYPITRYLFTIS
jgi:hypothetical protein